MPPFLPPPRQWPRHRISKLHRAALEGSVERTLALLSSGLFDIDGRAENYQVLWILPSDVGCSGGLLARRQDPFERGVDVSVVSYLDGTALHLSAFEGHLAVTKMLAKAGADPDAATSDDGATQR